MPIILSWPVFSTIPTSPKPLTYHLPYLFIHCLISVTGRVACKQMMPKDERRSIKEGKEGKEGKESN